MNILFHLHAYPIEVFAGAEMMAHRIVKFLTTKGHDVKVLSGSAVNKESIFDGVTVNKFIQDADYEYWTWADLVVTHLGNTHYCYNMQKRFKKKLIHLIHNTHEVQLTRAKPKNNYMVYNSEYSARKLRYPTESTVCIPPVDYREFEKVSNEGSNYFTLVNLNENKGGQLLIDVAKKMPSVQFLGVEGGYYEQIKGEVKNIKYVKPTDNMKDVYKKSKCVLILSRYESWGQVAVESLSSGVPVIVSNAEGVSEAVGYAGTYAERTVDSICEAITKMNDEGYYLSKKEEARKRAKELDPIPYLENLNEFLLKINRRNYQS